MKFALYIEPLTAFGHSFYTKQLLIDDFKKRGHTLTVFIPLQQQQLCKSLSNSKYLKQNEINDILNITEYVDFDNETLTKIIKLINNKASYPSIIEYINFFISNKKNYEKKLQKIEKKLAKLNKYKTQDANIVNEMSKDKYTYNIVNKVNVGEMVIDDVVVDDVVVDDVDELVYEVAIDDIVVDDIVVDDIMLDDIVVDDIMLDDIVLDEVDEVNVIINYNINTKTYEKTYKKTYGYNSSNQFIKSSEQLVKTPNIITSFPDPVVFDILLLTDTYTKKWYYSSDGHIHDCRNKIMNSFLKLGKKVICIRDTPLIEYRSMSNTNVKHGICINGVSNLHHKIPKFMMPLLSNLAFKKRNQMTRNEFCDKYGIDYDKKILCLLPGKISKWKSVKRSKNINSKLVATNVEVFYNRLDDLNQILLENNYVITSKLHTRDNYDKWLTQKTFRKDIIKYVDPNDSNEMLTYSDKGISFGTTMVYQTYLFNMPVLEIGTGMYYLGWSDSDANLESSPLKIYNYGKDLVFGKISQNFGKLPIKTLSNFITSEYDIKQFKYVRDNPIYGNSYNTCVEDVSNAILRQI
jgi:hypothetical protein